MQPRDTYRVEQQAANTWAVVKHSHSRRTVAGLSISEELIEVMGETDTAGKAAGIAAALKLADDTDANARRIQEEIDRQTLPTEQPMGEPIREAMRFAESRGPIAASSSIAERIFREAAGQHGPAVVFIDHIAQPRPALTAVPCRSCRNIDDEAQRCTFWQLEGPDVHNEGRMPRDLALQAAAAPEMRKALEYAWQLVNRDGWARSEEARRIILSAIQAADGIGQHIDVTR